MNSEPTSDINGSLPRSLPMIGAVIWTLFGFTLARSAQDPSLPSSLLTGTFLGAGQPGLWIALTGALCIILLVARDFAPAARRAIPSVGLVGALVMSSVSLVTLTREGKMATIHGQLRTWLDDDMMISLRYARHLALGDGLVWTTGERVEGMTNLLWTLCLTPLHWMLSQDLAAMGAIVLNSVLFLALLVATFRLARQLGGSEVCATLTALALGTNLPLLHWTTAGGEAILAALLLVILALWLCRGELSPKTGTWAGVVGGAIFLTRPDLVVATSILMIAFLIAAICCRPGTIEPERKRFAWRLVGTGATIVVIATLFRWLYYGSPLPNTYFLKATGWSGRGIVGLNYVLSKFLPAFGAVFVVAILAALRRASLPRLACVGAVVCHVLYVIWVGGDELPELRFMVPILPLLTALAFVAVDRAFDQVANTETSASWFQVNLSHSVPVFIPCAVLLLAGIGTALLPGVVPDRVAQRARSEAANVEIGLLVRANTKPEAKIAHFWAGAAAYYSNRPGIDLLGKCDATIAHQDAKPGLIAPGHNKYDFDYSLALEPDVIISGVPAISHIQSFQAKRDDAILHQYRNGPYRAFADFHDHAVFQQRYLRQAVGQDEGADPSIAHVTRFHGIFVRAESPHVPNATQWQVPTANDP